MGSRLRPEQEFLNIVRPRFALKEREKRVAVEHLDRHGLQLPLAFSVLHKGLEHSRPFQRAPQLLDVLGRERLEDDAVAVLINQGARPGFNFKLLAQPMRDDHLALHGEGDRAGLVSSLHGIQSYPFTDSKTISISVLPPWSRSCWVTASGGDATATSDAGRRLVPVDTGPQG